jgi:hypothetical protein
MRIELSKVMNVDAKPVRADLVLGKWVYSRELVIETAVGDVKLLLHSDRGRGDLVVDDWERDDD